MSTRVAILLAMACLGVPSVARADVLNRERYLVCRSDTSTPQAAPVREATPARRRVQKRSRPPALDAAETIVIDVPIAEARPGARREVPALDEPRSPERISDNDFRCLGFARGRAGVVRVIGSPIGTRFRRHPFAESWIADNMEAAGIGHVTEAIPYLRRELTRPIPDDLEPHARLVRLELRRSAASALADLGDTASIPGVLSFLRAREKADFPGLWEDALDALGRMDRAVAESYAIEVLERVAAEPTIDVGAENRARSALRLLQSPSSRALAVLTKLAATDAGPSRLAPCPVLGARIRVGDTALRDAIRPELATDLRTQRSAVCYTELVEAAFPGRDLSELDTLLYRHRYEELIVLVARHGKLAGPAADVAAARAKLKKWLDDRKADPEVAGDETDRRASSTERAKFLALGAALGDAGAERALAQMIVNPKDDGAGPWVGARTALDLGLTGAADLAATRLGLASTIWSSTVGHGGTTRRGAIVVNEHVDVVDRLAAAGDARFALGMLDRDAFSRRAATAHAVSLDPKASRVARERICEVIAAGAKTAEGGAVDDAFWAVSTWGTTCVPALRPLARDRKEPAHVRGMALEYLAMVRAVTDADVASETKDEVAVARARARLILSSPE